MKNYDLNIWDSLAYYSDYKHTGEWEINAYPIAMDQNGYYRQTDHNAMARFKLTKRQAELLGCSDEEPDFWVHADYLLEEPILPRRVKRWLENLTEGKI